MVHVGFSGTRRGMTREQSRALRRSLASFGEAILHHGDAVGADAEAHEQAVALGWSVIIHPPINEAWRARKVASEERAPKPHLVRNKDIVDETELLIAAPAEAVEILRSATWSTVRYARRLGRPIWIIRPDATVVREP